MSSNPLEKDGGRIIVSYESLVGSVVLTTHIHSKSSKISQAPQKITYSCPRLGATEGNYIKFYSKMGRIPKDRD